VVFLIEDFKLRGKEAACPVWCNILETPYQTLTKERPHTQPGGLVSALPVPSVNSDTRVLSASLYG